MSVSVPKEQQSLLEECQKALAALPEVKGFKSSDPRYWARRSHNTCNGRGAYIYNGKAVMCGCADRMLNRWRRDWLKRRQALAELTAEAQKMGDYFGPEESSCSENSQDGCKTLIEP